ncbi:uncharacterized protein C8A04DRAFT_25592 [Dichotomopilus funicola]|uniref:Uncharacterized protein n=1 Tax=Dichotomopilus funicola TaxID=1934379 RepID=A0AAN6V8G3_9PEZI|nr:hypothetical protein C8A04DRAFT_25592 [Dichotomopilus funicola]
MSANEKLDFGVITKMKTTTFFTAVAVLIVSAVALPNPNPAPEASPQICSCVLGCYDTCGAKLCC